jgi:hypothetical protein
MRGYHMVRCRKNGTVKRGDHWFCGTHDPIKVAERDEKKRAEWKAASDKRQAQFERGKVTEELCDGVDTEQIKTLGKGWVKLVLDSIQKAGYFGY